MWDLLADADWSHTTSHGDGDGAEMRSPDALVSVEHRRIAEGYEGRAWRIEVRPRPDEGPVIWTAWIAYEPPPHLISALASTLADPAPLQRTWTQNRAHYSARRTESRVTSEAHVAAHRARIETVRARVRAAHRANPGQHDAFTRPTPIATTGKVTPPSPRTTPDPMPCWPPSSRV